MQCSQQNLIAPSGANKAGSCDGLLLLTACMPALAVEAVVGLCAGHRCGISKLLLPVHLLNMHRQVGQAALLIP